MAITIRNTEEHEEMLSELKQLTRTSTMSKALIQGGYDLLKYHELYQKERVENERLRSELCRLKCKAGNFLQAFDQLKDVVED